MLTRPISVSPDRNVRFLILILALLSAFVPGARAGGKAPAGAATNPNPTKVDSVLIKKLYMNGDFDQAISILEQDYKTLKTLRHNDSVFIFKHLGVMYAANYETRERGKMYMHQLLMTEPTAKILDMYASDMIYMIFKNIKDEFDTNRGLLTDTTGSNPKPQPLPPPPPPKPEPSSRHLGFWIGGAAVVAAGIGAYVLILSLSHSNSQSHNF